MAGIAISNTSPLLYLHRIDAIDLLPGLCEEVWIPQAVAQELFEGGRRRYEVPDPRDYRWLTVTGGCGADRRDPAHSAHAGGTEGRPVKLLHTSDWHLAARGGTPRGAESGEAPG